MRQSPGLKPRGALTFQALVALALFALGALAVTSLSIRQLVATRHAAQALARDQLAESTMAGFEAAPYAQALGTRSLGVVVVDGLSFRQEATIAEEEGGKLLSITLRMWIEEKVDGVDRRRSPIWNYDKKVLRL